MSGKKVGVVLLLVFLGLYLPVEAQQKVSDETRLARIEERLTRLEEGQKALEQRIDDLRADMNARFADLNDRFADLNGRFTDINNRFDDLKSRFGWLYLLLSAIITLNGAMVGAVVWLARQDRPIGQRHYEQLIDREIELGTEIAKIKIRLDELETKVRSAV